MSGPTAPVGNPSAAPVARMPAPAHDRVAQPAADGVADKMAAENFPVALRFLPPAIRNDLRAVYTFARAVDDLGDEGIGAPRSALTPAARLAALEVVATHVRALFAGTDAPDVPGSDPAARSVAAVAGLRPLVCRQEIDATPLLDLIEANRGDQTVCSYASFDDLLEYCRLSAAPVGRIVLRLAGSTNPRDEQDSDSVCAALQVLEHCQDVGEDARSGRVYLPSTDLAHFGVEAKMLTARTASPALRAVVAVQVHRAETMLRAGRALPRRLHGPYRVAVAGFVAGGLATADALREADYDVLRMPVHPRGTRVARYAVALMCGAGR